MKNEKIILGEIKLVGISTRTNNSHIFEENPNTNKIAATVQKYFHNSLAEKILSRINPGVTYCVYTNYESDFTGDYTYFIGEKVSDFENINSELETLIIPAQTYMKFTDGPNKMPEVCINMWQEIWKMKELNRNYIADFEVYDERSRNHNHVTLDICIGINT